MRHLLYLFIISLFLLPSCASKNRDAASDEKIALATMRLGEEYYNSGNYTAALKKLLEAEKTIPEDPYLHNSLGLVYLAKLKYDIARDHFLLAVDYKPDYIQAKNNLGVAYLKQKKWDLAIQYFEETSKNILNATPERPLSNLGWVYFHQKRYRKAREYFTKSLDIRPNFLVSIHGLASTYLAAGALNDAIVLIKGALDRNPGAAILHSDLAKAYEATKDFEGAKRSWNIVLRLVPENSPLAKEAHKRLSSLN